MIVPPAGATKSLGLLIFGHGLFGDGRNYLTGVATSSSRWRRTSAPSSSRPTGWPVEAATPLIISNVIPNLNRVGIVTDRILQALVNNLSLVDSRRAPARPAGPALDSAAVIADPTEVHYYGVLEHRGRRSSRYRATSRGQSRCRSFVRATSSRARSTTSRSGSPSASTRTSSFGKKYHHAAPVASTRPTRSTSRRSSRRTAPERTVQPAHRAHQESIDDCQVPNLTTEMLARAYGLSQVTPDLVPIFGLPTLTTPTTDNACVAVQITSDVDKYVPPITNASSRRWTTALASISRSSATSLVTRSSAPGSRSCRAAPAGLCVLPWGLYALWWAHRMVPRSLLVLLTLLSSACFVRGGAGLLFLAADTAIIAAVVISATAPPPPRVVFMPEPREGFSWQPGYWTLREGNWEWVDGGWVQLQPGYGWAPAHWKGLAKRAAVAALVPGHWVPVTAPPQ